MLIFKNRNTFLLTLVLLTLLGSCKKDEQQVQPALVSFGPTTVNHGENIKFIGVGLDQVTDIIMPVGIDIPSSQFVSQSPTQIELTVPNESMVGYVTLKTAKGDITSKTPFGAAYQISVTSFTPSQAKPGTNVTISGNFLNYVKQVTFSNKLTVTQFVSQSLNQLVVTVPMTAQTGGISLTDLAKTPSVVDQDSKGNALVLNVNLPVVTSLSPANIEQTTNLTIAGTDLDIVNEIDLAGGTNGVKIMPPFVSQSTTQIVLTVPNTAITGTLTLTALSGVKTVTSQTLTVLEPKATSLTPQPAVPGTGNITITGTDLNLVASLTLSGVAQPVLSASFISQSPTQIVLLLPAGAVSGGVNYTTIHGYSNKLGVSVTIPAPGPPMLPIVLFDETFAPGGGDWSWNAVISDHANTEQFYSGNVSWKYSTTSSGGLSSGGITAIDASGQAAFVFSLYGGPGTDGAKVAAILNDNWGDYNTVTLAEGKWTEYKIPVTKYPTTDLTKIVRFAFKVDDGRTSSMMYADRVGFGDAGPAPLTYYVFDDQLHSPFGLGGGWGSATTDAASIEQVRVGQKSVKATFAGSYSGASQFGSWGNSPKDVSGMQNFGFSIYGGTGTNGKSVIINIRPTDSGTDVQVQVTVTEGAWKDVVLPLSQFGSPATVGGISFQDANWSGTVYIDAVGFK